MGPENLAQEGRLLLALAATASNRSFVGRSRPAPSFHMAEQIPFLTTWLASLHDKLRETLNIHDEINNYRYRCDR